jgi:uncharacterized membrane protein YhaH (DUF805 family)
MNQPVTNSGNQNPYSAPRSQTISGIDDDLPQEVKIFSVSGRIGRARYVVYLFGLSILIMLGGFLLSLITAGFAMVPAYIALLVIQFMLTIQRCHDFDTSGWLSILILVPLVNFMFIFIPGTKGTNRWGSKTTPNSTPMVIGAWLCALVIPLSGILAAIAIPQYQKYVERAKATQAR